MMAQVAVMQPVQQMKSPLHGRKDIVLDYFGTDPFNC